MMHQAKFSLTLALVDFLNNYKRYGFKDKSSMVRAALLLLEEELEVQGLRQSADLYAEICEEDDELQQIMDSAVSGWPK